VRHIAGHPIRPSADWLIRAAKVEAKIIAIAEGLEGATPEQVKAIHKELGNIFANASHLWSELKPDLEALSFGKCWYCETKQVRSPLAVDHFRPKSRVAECAHHHGYWWLALDPQNYRCACSYCNSPMSADASKDTLGKGVHFPLIDEALRNLRPEDEKNESPCLLDPTVEVDPGYLWFMQDGQATPKHPRERSELFFKRADVSIRFYNLNDSKIADARSILAYEIKRQVIRGDKYLNDALAGDPAAYEHYEEVVRFLLKVIRPQSEYSAAARAFLAIYRDKEWVVTVLVTA